MATSPDTEGHTVIRGTRTVVAIVLLLAAARSHALTADSADDVCPVDADPCIVTEPVEVTPGAILDFQRRAVQVTGKGRFDFGAGSAQIRSGSFVTSTTGDAIVAAGRDDTGTTRGGTVTIEALRTCSAGSPQDSCLRNFDCQFGACDARRCSGRPNQTCTSDASCTGSCINEWCSNPGTSTRCSTNADCDFGPCPEQLTCRRGAYVRNCSANADCNLGTCSIGEAPITIGGSIDGRAEFPGKVLLRGAGPVNVTGNVDLSGTGHETDGGELEVVGGSGVALSGSLRATSGGLGTGGELTVDGWNDIVVSGAVDLSGGAYDGGTVDLFSRQGDVVLLADVDLSAKSGAGYGGFMTIDAGRDLTIGNGVDPLRIRANGHTDHVDGGDAGTFELFAYRDVRVHRGVKIIARGAGLYAFGGSLGISGDRDFWFDGRFDARAPLAEGTGGYSQLHFLGDIVVGKDARFDLRGGYGAILELYSEFGDAAFDGRVRTSGEFDGENGVLEVWACKVAISGRLTNSVDMGITEIFGRESVHILPEAVLLARRGEVLLEYGIEDIPPVVEGKIKSMDLFIEHLEEFDCPVCGDGVVDDYVEECDDGNEADGDGCSGNCRIE